MIRRSRVDFPQPLEPTTLMNSPGRMLRSMSSSTVSGRFSTRYCLFSWRISSAAAWAMGQVLEKRKKGSATRGVAVTPAQQTAFQGFGSDVQGKADRTHQHDAQQHAVHTKLGTAFHQQHAHAIAGTEHVFGAQGG